MSLYPYALFCHIVGVLGLFISISLEVTGMFRMRAAKTTAQIQEWMAVNRALEKTLPTSAVLILVSGLFMTFTAWGWEHAWIDLSLALLVAVGVLASVINGSRMKAIQKEVKAAADGPVPASLQQRIFDPVLRTYALIPGCIALGAVALMVLKLDWIGSIGIMLLAIIVGIILGQLPRGTTTPSISN